MSGIDSQNKWAIGLIWKTLTLPTNQNTLNRFGGCLSKFMTKGYCIKVTPFNLILPKLEQD